MTNQLTFSRTSLAAYGRRDRPSLVADGPPGGRPGQRREGEQYTKTTTQTL